MKKFTILFFILLLGCVERPYNEAYFIGEGEDIIEPEEDIVEPEEDVVSVDADDEDTWVDTYIPEDTWQPEDTYTPQDTYQPPQDTWTPPQDTYTPPKDTYQPPQDTNKPEDTKPQLGPGECPKDCKTWYDGCNTCQCNSGKIGGCTKMGCPTKKEPYCKKLHGT